MTVKSLFDFKFPAEHREEGLDLARQIGHDMVGRDGYLDHEVLQDLKDAGHLMVNTHWRDEGAANATLTSYVQDAKVARATALCGAEPAGFVATVDR